MHRQYHNITAKYNGYFNARTKFEEAVQELELQNKDDFSKILPVFNHGDKQAAKGKSQIFDEVIKKCSAVVTNHEVSKWVDDSFFLIGKAYFFKGEYFEAIETFQYVFNKYKNEEVAKESLIWLVKAYLETDQLANARAAIDRGLSDKRFPPNLKAALHAAAAAYFIKDKRFEQAIESLDKAVKTEGRRSSRRRMYFVLGQLNQRYGSGRKAIANYDQVLGMNPSYEMQFDAKLNIARCAEAGNANTASIRQELVRMARDDKNKGNLDILYYEIGQLDVKMKQLPSAEENFKKAALNAGQNPGNKGLAFLALSKIYFNTRRYKDADTYYDSTLAFLSKEHPDYEETGNRKKFLADLVKQIDIITLEDSLQRLARMPDKQLNRLIDRVISDERVAKDRERFQKEQPQANNMPQPQDMNRPGGPGLPPGPGGGGGISLPGQSGRALFYFYNQANLSLGFTEFLTRWGNRELTDNWRRSKREQAIAGPANNEPPVDTSSIPDTDESGKKLSREEKEARMQKQRMLAKIPKSESQKQASDERIAEAMYQLGLLYKEKLKEDDESINQWEGLLQRFPKTRKKPETAYGLWQVFSKNGNTAKAAFYKKLLEENFKDSPYNELINNPEKPIALSGPVGKAEKDLYENAYRAYTRKNYQEAFTLAEKARKELSGSKLLPKFDLIRAVSLGKVKDSAAMRQALEMIVAQYPKDPVKASAEDMLKVLKGEGFKSAAAGKDSAQVAAKEGFVKPPPSGNALLDSLRDAAYAMYKSEAPKSYYFVLWIQDTEARKASPDVKLVDFNTRLYSLQSFDVEPTLYDAATQMVIVKQFTQKDKAMDYYSAFIADKTVTAAYAPGSWQAVLISPENLITLRKKMGKPAYLQYFKDQFQFKKN